MKLFKISVLINAGISFLAACIALYIGFQHNSQGEFFDTATGNIGYGYSGLMFFSAFLYVFFLGSALIAFGWGLRKTIQFFVGVAQMFRKGRPIAVSRQSLLLLILVGLIGIIWFVVPWEGAAYFKRHPKTEELVVILPLGFILEVERTADIEGLRTIIHMGLYLPTPWCNIFISNNYLIRMLTRMPDKEELPELIKEAGSDHLDKVKALIAKGADVNVKSSGGETALLLAASTGNSEMAKVLISAGARDDDGRAFSSAAGQGYAEIAESLYKPGKTNLNSKEPETGMTLLMKTCGWGSGEDDDYMKVLLWRDEHGRYFAEQPAKESPKRDFRRVFQFLLKNGADVNLKENHNQTALMIAMDWGSPEAAKLLVAKGADVNFQSDDGTTPLMKAAFCSRTSYPELMTLLLARGAKIHAKDHYGHTALDIAIMYRQADSVELLKKAGAVPPSRRASPPGNWKVECDAVSRPYEGIYILIKGPVLQGENWQLSADTRIDDKEIGEEFQRGHLSIQGWGPYRGEQGIQLCISYFPVFQFPKSFGKHPIDLVISTKDRDYHFRRFTLLLDATKEERGQIAELEKSGASSFLNDEYGFTPRYSKEKKSMPYAAVLDFVERYPDSYLVKVIDRRINLIWLWDVNDGPIDAAERLWLGKTLGAIDKDRYVADFKEKVKDKFGPDVSNLWLDAVKFYHRAK